MMMRDEVYIDKANTKRRTSNLFDKSHQALLHAANAHGQRRVKPPRYSNRASRLCARKPMTAVNSNNNNNNVQINSADKRVVLHITRVCRKGLRGVHLRWDRR